MNEEIVVDEILEETIEPTIDYTDLLTEIKQNTQIIKETEQKTYADVHIIMIFTIFTFTWSCMRAWRKNVLKGV